MGDTYSKTVRSYTMSRIRKTDTKPELLVRKYLFKNGFRYRLYNRNLPGNPDIVLPKYKTIIFVNGCFWHAHTGCKLNRLPKSRVEYWVPKIMRNVERDKINARTLKKDGWKILIVWECDLHKNKSERTLTGIVKKLKRIAE